MTAEIPAISYDELFTSQGDDCYLGEGSFSLVYRCHHHEIGDVAVKIMKNSTRDEITQFNKEGCMHLRANKCPNILKLHGLAQKQNFVGLVLEYMPYGSLASAVRSYHPLPWSFRLRALSEIASALYYLHNLPGQRRLVHCDIKIENILLNRDLHIKIGDFGGADFSTFTGHIITRTSRGQAGVAVDAKKVEYTLAYAAPELIKNLDKRRTTAMDVYSFAIVMYVMATRKNPFEAMERDLIIHAVTTGQRPEQGLEDVDEDLKDDGDTIGQQVFRLLQHLMPQCWRQTPSARLPIMNVRDSLTNKFNSLPKQMVEDHLSDLMKTLRRGGNGMPADAIPVVDKYNSLIKDERLTPPISGFGVPPRTFSSRPEPPRSKSESNDSNVSRPALLSRSTSSPVPQPRSRNLQTPHRMADTVPKEGVSGLHISGARASINPPSAELMELETSFRDPYLRQGNAVTMITDLAAVKNAQVGHGGWDDKLLRLRDIQGTVRSVESNGDVTVDFSGIESHRFNPSSLTKLPSDRDLSVGDFVKITLEIEVVKAMQENHGGWTDDMQNYFNTPGLVFRFLPDRDVLVVYKSGSYFRYNPEVLVKFSQPTEKVKLRDNPNISIGDYVCHELEADLVKDLQKNCGGWNDAMADLKGKVGKFVYADYHGRAFIAYGSKLCFVFNPAVLNKLTKEEAVQRFKNSREDVKRLAKERIENRMMQHRFAVDDQVRVQLPLDIVVELQKGHGGWCYQMLEVYGISGIVKEFDEGNNAQVLFDSGNKWTFNPAAIEKVERGSEDIRPAYVPPFKIGDKVRVKLKDLNNASLNKMRHAFKMLDIPEDKVEILMKIGTVLGIDDDIDVIVSFGDGKNYGLKPEQLERIQADGLHNIL